MKVYGALVVPPKESGHTLAVVPLDKGRMEFVQLDACPPAMMEILSNIADENDCIVLGALVDATQ